MTTPQHSIGSGFGARSTADDVLSGIDLSGIMARRLTGEDTLSWRDPTPWTKQMIPG